MRSKRIPCLYGQKNQSPAAQLRDHIFAFIKLENENQYANKNVFRVRNKVFCMQKEVKNVRL